MSVRHALVPHLDGESTLQDGMSLQGIYNFLLIDILLITCNPSSCLSGWTIG